ncbi:hypothetical protein GYB22_08280 [bacterium]|nr:hypothetical protein [bacterium]
MKRFSIPSDFEGHKIRREQNILVPVNNDFEDIQRIMTEHSLSKLEINELYYPFDNIDFIKNLIGLVSLRVIGISPIDITPINSLRTLKELVLETKHDGTLDLSKLMSLNTIHIDGRIKGAESALKHSNVKSLVINNYQETDLEKLVEAKKLRELTINAGRKLKVINSIRNMDSLSLLHLNLCPKLSDVTVLKNASHIECLLISGKNDIVDFSPIFEMKNLKILYLTDIPKIETIKGVANLDKLEVFNFAGQTNIIDGDLSDLDVLKSRNPNFKANFARLRHYSHNAIDFR